MFNDKAGAGAPGERRFKPKGHRVCRFCKNKQEDIDFKDVKLLTRYISDRGKILPRRVTGNCAKHQRKICCAVKKARCIALVPYVPE